MKGAIIHYSTHEKSGCIQAENLLEYPFHLQQWRASTPPMLNQHVEFTIDAADDVTAVYLVEERPPATAVQQNVMPFLQSKTSAAHAEEDFGTIDWFLKCISSHYFNFSGRARRREFWSFMLVGLMVGFFTTATDSIFGISVVTYLVNGALLIPLFAVGARRLHDIGLSGWWQLLYATGLGIALLLIFWLIRSEAEINRYGESPKQNHETEHAYS